MKYLIVLSLLVLSGCKKPFFTTWYEDPNLTNAKKFYTECVDKYLEAFKKVYIDHQPYDYERRYIEDMCGSQAWEVLNGKTPTEHLDMGL